jgi:hypothetical protein
MDTAAPNLAPQWQMAQWTYSRGPREETVSSLSWHRSRMSTCTVPWLHGQSSRTSRRGLVPGRFGLFLIDKMLPGAGTRTPVCGWNLGPQVRLPMLSGHSNVPGHLRSCPFGRRRRHMPRALEAASSGACMPERGWAPRLVDGARPGRQDAAFARAEDPARQPEPELQVQVAAVAPPGRGETAGQRRQAGSTTTRCRIRDSRQGCSAS